MNINEINLQSIHERELHPFLVYFLNKKMNIYSKTIYHEGSIKTGKGKNEWLHPDIVGFNLPVENLNEKVLDLCGKFSINRATIYSFELKKSITTESLREQFFQAVSNSSWANEGYLVGVDIDTDNNELMQEINRLSSAFNIGVIKLNLLKPELSEILVYARRKDTLEAETMNKLFSINRDFKEFIDTVLKSININQVINTGLDKVFKKDDLKLIINEYTKEDEIITTKSAEISTEDTNLKYYNLDNDFTGTTPKTLNIKNNTIDVSSWREVYISICEYLIKKDKEKFINLKDIIKGKNRPYFTNIKEDVRVPYYFSSIDLYIEINLSAKSIIVNIKKLLDYYNIDKSDVLISIK